MKCRTCAIRQPEGSICRLTGREINPDKDFCSSHRKEIIICEVCDNGTLAPIVVLSDDGNHIVCENCNGSLSSCHFCLNSSSCAFETDPSPLPKLIQKQIRQGPMTTVTTVKNPDRVRETCMKGCPCFDEENGCLRQFNYCGGLKHVWDHH